MATRSSILAWEIPWTEEPGGLRSMGSQTDRHSLAAEQEQQQGWSLRFKEREKKKRLNEKIHIKPLAQA